MNWLVRIMGLILVLSASNAEAIDMPGWERPILGADMEILEASGNFNDVESAVVTLTRQDYANRETGIDLILNRGETITPIFFTIVRVGRDGCGSTIYYGELPRVVRGFQPPFSSTQLTLVDHATRLCLDLKPHRWEAELTESMMCTPPSHLSLAGNPEDLVSILSLQ